MPQSPHDIGPFSSRRELRANREYFLRRATETEIRRKIDADDLYMPNYEREYRRLRAGGSKFNRLWRAAVAEGFEDGAFLELLDYSGMYYKEEGENAVSYRDVRVTKTPVLQRIRTAGMEAVFFENGDIAEVPPAIASSIRDELRSNNP